MIFVPILTGELARACVIFGSWRTKSVWKTILWATPRASIMVSPGAESSSAYGIATMVFNALP